MHHRHTTPALFEQLPPGRGLDPDHGVGGVRGGAIQDPAQCTVCRVCRAAARPRAKMCRMM